MKYLSVCSGIEAASVAWHPLGWKPLAFSEIEAFPRAVLAHHYPDVPLHGDFTQLRDMPFIVDADVLVGGTPCQAFSVAGLRRSLDDDRGNLSLEFVRLADAIDDLRSTRGRAPAVILWENVPGVLSVKDNAFGCFLAALAGDVAPYVPPRGKWTDAGVVLGPQRAVAWRILDAQCFGLAQRRRRVFVVSSAREGFDPAAVLLEREGVRRDTPPRREAGQVAPTIPSRSTAGGGLGTDFDLDGGVIQAPNRDVYPTLDTMMDRKWGSHQWVDSGMAVLQPVIMSSGQANAEIRVDGGAPSLTCLHEAPIIAHTLKAEGFDASEDGTGRGTPLVPVAGAICKDSFTGGAGGRPEGAAAGHFIPTVYSIMPQNSGRDYKARPVEVAQPIMAGGPVGGNQGGDYVQQHMAVRRLTPVECERLQGFPDNYTLIPWRNKPAADCPDGPRYKALGNSMAVPCMRWIGERINAEVSK